MKRTIPALFLVLLSAAAAAAQTATPTPDDRDVVKIETNLIQLDVTVTDKKGNPIRDLRRDEIEIYENGKRQDVSGFSFIDGLRRTAPGEREARPQAPAVPLPGVPRPENIRRTMVLVVDDLTLSFASSYWVKTALKKFINEQMQDGDLVAIVRTASGVGVMQQFTTDKRQLLAAADKVRFHMGPSTRVGVFNPIAPTHKQFLGRTGDQVSAELDYEREVAQSREAIFTSGTLGAVNYVVRGMSSLPGRKSVVLLSDGFPIVVRDRNGMAHSARILDQLRRLTDLANRASVVIYSIDARGLIEPGPTAEDSFTGMNEQDITQSLRDRENRLFDTQSGLSYLSNQTGGMAILNSNDINWGLGRVMDDQSYYLVAYEPEGGTFDPRTRRYNKIDVKVLREGARVRHRSGFFGIADSAIKRTSANPEQAILDALTSPFAVNDISVRLNAVFTAPERDKMFVRSYIHMDAKDLTLSERPDGDREAALDVVAMTFGDNGTVVDEHSRRYTITLKPEAYDRVLKKGFVYEFALPLKKPGAIQMRVAVRDAGSGKVGSASQFLEVPNVKKDRLTLSGVIFESMPLSAWEKIVADRSAYEQIRERTDPMTDTSLRQFEPGTALRYGVEIYNAKAGPGGARQLVKVIKLFREGEEFYTSPEMPVEAAAPTAAGGITTTGTVRIGDAMPLGEYVLQIAVHDKLAGDKRGTATQFVTFEVVK